MPTWSLAWPIARLLAHILLGALISTAVAAARALGGTCAWYPAVVRWWHARLCRILRLRIRATGQPVAGALLVANHISWLDIPALGAQAPIGFLSKAEVRRWPLVGWMAVVAGTLFIERGGHQTEHAIASIRERLLAGGQVLAFPEGTTSDGNTLLPFFPRLFAVVTDATCPLRVQPVTIRYGSNARPDPIAPFIGKDRLLAHLLRLLRHPGIAVEIGFLPPIEPAGQDRRTFARLAQQAVAERLDLPDPAVTRQRRLARRAA